jgi:hypothetical protein
LKKTNENILKAAIYGVVNTATSKGNYANLSEPGTNAVTSITMLSLNGYFMIF